MKLSPEKWQAILDDNHPFHLIAACLPAMREAGYGRIINIASAHGLVASIHKSAYVAAKHGLVGLTKTIALEARIVILPVMLFVGLCDDPVGGRAGARPSGKTGLDFEAAGPASSRINTPQAAL